MEATWDNQLFMARKLDDDELARHASVCINNRHNCTDSDKDDRGFTCACVEVQKEREAISADNQPNHDDDTKPEGEQTGMATYQGTENTTKARVRQYLMENYAVEGGDTMTGEMADALLALYSTEIRAGESVRSFAYYVGDNIAKAERLVYVGTEEDEEES